MLLHLCLTFPILILLVFFFFFNDTATTEIYTLSLHDALPISAFQIARQSVELLSLATPGSAFVLSLSSRVGISLRMVITRSEEHTSELQSHVNLVCRLLLEKKKKKKEL